MSTLDKPNELQFRWTFRLQNSPYFLRQPKTRERSNKSRGATPLYKPCGYVPTQRVGFWGRFSMKTSIDFAHFGLESGWFTKELRLCVNVFVVSIPNK